MHMTRPSKGARNVIGWRLFPAPFAIVSLVAAACGDDSSTDSVEEPAPTTSPAADEPAPTTSAAADDRNCVDEVVIGTVWPMSGTFSFVGSAEIASATKAVEDINAAGGIESLCGAMLRLAIYDAGGSAEEAATAVERLLDDEPDVSAIAGSWLSSFSLAATEVSERAGIPFVTESFADSVTDREGFSHVFGYSPPASAIKGLILDAIQPGLDQAGITMETVAVVGSTSAAAVPLQEALLAEFGERGSKSQSLTRGRRTGSTTSQAWRRRSPTPTWTSSSTSHSPSVT